MGDNENAEKCLSIGFNMVQCKSQRTLGCAWMEEEEEDIESESSEIADQSEETESEAEMETESSAGGWCYSPEIDNENAEKCLSIGFNMAKCKSQRALGCAWMEEEESDETETDDVEEEEG